VKDTTTKHPTYFVDIDGTLIKYRSFQEIGITKPKAIKSVLEKINTEFDKGAHIVVTSARPEALRRETIEELFHIGLRYHQLVLGIGRSTRYLVNDIDPEQPEIPRAVAINLIRNNGGIELF